MLYLLQSVATRSHRPALNNFVAEDINFGYDAVFKTYNKDSEYAIPDQDNAPTTDQSN